MRIDILMPIKSQYGVLHRFTTDFYEALQRAGASCRLISTEKINWDTFLDNFFEDEPDVTLSFNGLLPYENGEFLADLIKKPHVCCLVDSPTRFLPLIHSSYNIITCVDVAACHFLKGLHHEKTLFMPHAISKDLVYSIEERSIDILVLGSCIDYEPIAKSWMEQYPKAVTDAIFQAAEVVLGDQETSFIDAFNMSVQNLLMTHPDLDVSQVNFIAILNQLEDYVIGVDRIRAIRTIKDIPIDIYGHSKALWEHYLGAQKNCRLHEPVPFTEAIELMKKAKFLLNSCIAIKGGGHERMFAAMASGAVVLASENEFMKKTFNDQESIIFYRNGHLSDINEKIHSLKDEGKRQLIAQAGHDIVKRYHTWDQRAVYLLENLKKLIGQANMTQ